MTRGDQHSRSPAIATALAVWGKQVKPEGAEDFAKDEVRKKWREEKGLTVFSLWSPSYPGTEVDLFVEEPFDFEEAWSRRLDAVLDDGTTVHVVGMNDLRSLKQATGRPKDLDDLEKLDQIVRAMLGQDDNDG